jgi:hypothetical protein
METRDCFTRVEWQGCKADYTPTFSAEDKNSGAIPPLLICLQDIVLYLLSRGRTLLSVCLPILAYTVYDLTTLTLKIQNNALV